MVTGAMGRSFATSTAAVLHGDVDEELVQSLREATCDHPATQRMRQSRFERMIQVASRRLDSVTVVLENLADTHNCSAVVRSAEGLGLSSVHVVEQPRRFRKHHQILKGADRWIEIERHRSIEQCLEALHRQGFSTWAADVGPDCVPIEELDVSGPTAVILGTEMDGLTDEARRHATGRFTIPMYGFTGSFNVSVSAAVALSSLSSRRRKHLARASDRSTEQASTLLQGWLDRDWQQRGARRRRTIHIEGPRKGTAG